MPEGSYLYCDVSLPVPLDQPFTYALPETLRHRVRPGSRMVVPFGPRKLTGVILRCHDEPPAMATREALRLIDAEPVLDAELLALGRWIAGYYCAPLGDVLRGMLPLASEIRRGKVWSLTDAGRDAARQLAARHRAGRPGGAGAAAARKAAALGGLPGKARCRWPIKPSARWSAKASSWPSRCRPSATRCARPPSGLRVELAGAGPAAEPKLNKPERELRAFLELHPGSHNLKDLEDHGAPCQPGGALAGAQRAGLAEDRKPGARRGRRGRPSARAA